MVYFERLDSFEPGGERDSRSINSPSRIKYTTRGCKSPFLINIHKIYICIADAIISQTTKDRSPAKNKSKFTKSSSFNPLIFRVRPSPLPDLQRINPILIRTSLHLQLLIQQLLPHPRRLIMQARDPINRIHRQTIPVRLIPDRQLERGVDVALLLVAANVQVEAAGPLVGQAVDEEGVGVEVEDDGAVGGEDGAVFAIREAVGMVDVGDELEEVDDVDEADFEGGDVFAEEGDGGEGFGGGDVAAGGHDDVGVGALVVGGPVPDSETFGAVLHC
jgi:hypothetical protein